MMKWWSVLGVALLTGPIGLISVGCLGIVCVEWYSISSFEGASGFFVVGLALLGGLLGTIVGMVTSLILVSRTQPVRFLSLIGYAWASWFVLLVVVTGMCWAFAGAPFGIDGQGPIGEIDPAVNEDANDATAFELLRPDAPIKDWLPYTRVGVPDDQRATALTHITARGTLVTELATLVRSDDLEVASDAIRVIQSLPKPPRELIPVLVDVGNQIIRQIESVNSTSVEQDPEYQQAAEVSNRFSAWMGAAIHLREHCNADFSAELKRILELSRVRDDSQVMQQDVRRVASYYMQQWTGLEPLPTDPKAN